MRDLLSPSKALAPSTTGAWSHDMVPNIANGFGRLWGLHREVVPPHSFLVGLNQTQSLTLLLRACTRKISTAMVFCHRTHSVDFRTFRNSERDVCIMFFENVKNSATDISDFKLLKEAQPDFSKSPPKASVFSMM
jgi:hypothetical protein